MRTCTQSVSLLFFRLQWGLVAELGGGSKAFRSRAFGCSLFSEWFQLALVVVQWLLLPILQVLLARFISEKE